MNVFSQNDSSLQSNPGANSRKMYHTQELIKKQNDLFSKKLKSVEKPSVQLSADSTNKAAVFSGDSARHRLSSLLKEKRLAPHSKSKFQEGTLKGALKNKIDKSPARSKVTIEGSITNQFDYGAVPYYIGGALPASLFRSSGSLSLKNKRLPLKLDYFYSNPKAVSGLNNYFTIRFDREEFQKMQNVALLDQSMKLRERIDSLRQERSVVLQKLNGLQTLQKNKNLQDLLSKPGFVKGLVKLTMPGDSLHLNDLKPPGIHASGFPADTLHTALPSLDSSYAKIQKLQDRIDKIDQLIKIFDQKVKAAEYPKPGVPASQLFPQSKLAGFMSGIKKLEIGMCYPSYSTFMINQTALKGVNVGYTFKNAFLDATYGKTIVNYSVQTTANSVINQIQSLTGFFDWNKDPDQKKIASARFGIGKESKNYIALGGLYGMGTNSMLSPDIKRNYVFEVDGRYIYKFVNAEASFAKSYLVDKTATLTTPEQTNSSQATNWSRSLQVKIYGVLPKLNTRFSLLYKMVEPYFKSFGVSFMRSDILRYESKLEQPIGKLLKIGFSYRRDADNLKKLQSYSTVLQNFTYSAKLKLFRRKMDLALNYTQIYQNTTNLLQPSTQHIKSDLATIIVTYPVKIKRVISTNNFLTNIYALQDYTRKSLFSSFSFNSMNQYKSWHFNSMNSYNKSTLTDSLNYVNAINNTLEIGYQLNDSYRLSIGGKHAFQLGRNISEFGYSITLNLRLHRLCNIELKAEKLVIGDFINTLNYSSIRQFPFYGYVKVVSTF